ncbi:MAG: FG-GAP-like repeat-containing protein [Planctomycetaceae bacterium]
MKMSRKFTVGALAAAVILLAVMLAIFRRNDDRQPENELEIQSLLTLAQKAKDKGDPKKAAQWYAEVAALTSQHPEAFEFLALYELDQENWKQAEHYASFLSESEPRYKAVGRYVEGRIKLQNNSAAEAEEKFREATSLDPSASPAGRDLAVLLAMQFRETDLRKLLAELQKTRGLSLDELVMRLLAGREIIGREQALPAVQNYLRTNSADTHSRLAVARYLVLSGATEEAISVLGQRNENDSQSELLRQCLLAESSQRKIEGAREPQKQTLTSEDPVEAWLLAARQASEEGNWGQAAEIYRYLAGQHPYSTAIRHLFAVSLDRIGQSEAASMQHRSTSDLDELEQLAYRMQRPQAKDPEMAVPVVERIIHLLESLERPQDALDWLSVLSQLQPAHSQIPAMQARLRQQLERKTTEPPSLLVAEVTFRGRLPESKAQQTASDTEANEEEWLLTDKAADWELQFSYHNGQSQFKRILETIGGGCAVLDVDNDLWPDLFFPQGQRAASGNSPGETGPDNIAPVLTDQLFRNLRGTRLREITFAAGTQDTAHSFAAAIGDFDVDGFDDILVTNLGSCRLLRGNGDGTFDDATPPPMKAQNACSSGACFVDLNGDGLPEIFVLNYVADWDRRCLNSTGSYATCDPRECRSTTNHLYQNNGDMSFIDVSEDSGLSNVPGRALGVVSADFSGDGKPDIFVANDGLPNSLFVQKDDEAKIVLQDIAATAGVAVDDQGRAMAGMGIAWSDFDHNGFGDLFVTNFYREMNTLYSGLEGGLFVNQTKSSELGESSLQYLGFGTQAIDINNDGHDDIVVLNGDIDDYSASGRRWKMPALVYRNLGNGVFQNRSQHCGADLQKPIIGRGLTRVDINRDGRSDLVAVRHDGNAMLLANETNAPAPVARVFYSHRHQYQGPIAIPGSQGSNHFQATPTGDGFAAANERLLVILPNSKDAQTNHSAVRIVNEGQSEEFIGTNRRVMTTTKQE